MSFGASSSRSDNDEINDNNQERREILAGETTNGERHLRSSSWEAAESVPSATTQGAPPLFTFGVIADIQYAPVPDGFSFAGTPRYYRHSLDVARRTARHFQEDKVRLVVNLGDIVDGKCQTNSATTIVPTSTSSSCSNNGAVTSNNDQERQEEGSQHGHSTTTAMTATATMTTTTTTTTAVDDDDSDDDDDPGRCVAAADRVLEALSAYRRGPVLHAYGNHCLYNMDRSELQAKLGIPFVREEPHGELVGYYSHLVEVQTRQYKYNDDDDDDDDIVGHNNNNNNVRFVVLDSYDVATMRRCEETSAKHRAAVEILTRNNPNYSLRGEENSPAGLEGLDRRFVAFNGAVGRVQLQWLRDTLDLSRRRRNEKVIILSHQPIHPDSTHPVCLMWNYQQVLDVLREYRDVVVASFAGHAHKGGYARDDLDDHLDDNDEHNDDSGSGMSTSTSTIHFRVFEAALENPHPHKTYAMVDVYRDSLRVRGFGNCASAVYQF